MIRKTVHALIAVLALALAAAPGAAGAAGQDALRLCDREAGLLAMVNESVNESHMPGARFPSDPDGVWDAGNYAAAKYRSLRDEFRWSPYRLAIGLVKLPDGKRNLVVLVKGFESDDWAILDWTTNEIVPLRTREREHWKVQFADFEPAPSPAAAWVMTARLTPTPLFR